VTPDLDTYHLLLDAILLRPLSSAELFELLIKSLEDKSLAYTPATYERIIAFLCSQPKDVWERDAFTYLEDLVAETKRQILLARSSAVVGATAPAASQPVFGPTYRTYEVMLRRCVHERDPRALQLQEEMRSFGFAPSAELMAQLSVAQLWTGTLPRRKAGGADFDLGVDQHGRTHGAPPKPPRPSSIALDHLPLSEDGKIPPHVRDA
jgi:Arc/MetJ family transcription regulator